MSDPPGLIFESADGEVGAGLTVAEILAHKGFKAAAALALRDVDELVQKQFAIAPTIGANNDSMTDGHAARSVGNDMGAPRRRRQFLIIR